jgi:hypothetical protein
MNEINVTQSQIMDFTETTIWNEVYLNKKI